ncbi:hypothetical protein [Streptomyces sp. NBC_00102]|uniref:hypothetical protein n=1 Tax=Streptomyces sp. NBC_00102 TaxID=2975652 RepID=UPI0022546001|nr:hypothetical protein [Streptomyces sp. NBC_00102]MCX5401634.1 hypothetical protein [Streptomyces sp. NBC_00102]
MLRRIAITVATVAAAGLMAAGPAAAHGNDQGGESVEVAAGYFQAEASRENAEYLNLGGPYGITYASEERESAAVEAGFLWAQYLNND